MAVVVLASDPLYANCNPVLSVVCGAIVNGWKLASLGWSFQEESPGQWNLHGCGVDRCERGHPGPLASIWHSVMAWAMVHQPSCIVKGLVARYAGLPTQVPTPVSVNPASLTLPRLRPSPNDSLP